MGLQYRGFKVGEGGEADVEISRENEKSFNSSVIR